MMSELRLDKLAPLILISMHGSAAAKSSRGARHSLRANVFHCFALCTVGSVESVEEPSLTYSKVTRTSPQVVDALPRLVRTRSVF
jgi:hypothetical protein